MVGRGEARAYAARRTRALKMELPTVKTISHGVHYSVFSLLTDARHFDELGKRPDIRFYRDSTGRIDGIELLTPRATQTEDRCGKCGDWRGSVDEGSICWNHDTPDGYPEPNGIHEWARFE